MASDAREITYRFDCEALGGTVPPLRRVRLVEALNEPYRLTVDCVLASPTFDAAELVGKDCALEIIRSDTNVRRVCGIITEARETDMPEAPATRLTITPALWMLSLNRDSRIFQDESADAILERVLGEALGAYGREVSLELEGSYPVREYCVQYQESDLDFAHRLMEEEGISYAFEHDGDVERMVLRDRNASFPDLAVGRHVPYEPHNLEIEGTEPIVHVRRDHRPTVTGVVTRDWDWTRGGSMTIEAAQPGEGQDGRTRESYEHGRGRSATIWSYDQGVRRYQQQDAAAQAGVRREAHARDAVVAVMLGRVASVEPGRVFELGGHPSVGLDDTYLITRAEHVSDALSSVLPDAGTSDPYYNRFECIPFSTTYRPERLAPKPSIASIQTAVVTGPAGEEVHVDEHGRIKVQFHWDREGQNDEQSSCWVRVQQPWAGAGWGFWWVPRIGMEVVVHFVDGDPDRPLVTASVYDGVNATPYGLPDDKTKSTIKSNSSLGGGGFNEFRFEDKAGEEEIYTHAQKDYNEVVENDHTTLVHHDQTNTVDNDQTQIVKANQTETVNANQQLTVEGNRTVHVKTNFDEKVDGAETRRTVGDVEESFDANEARAITGNVDEKVTANESRFVGGNQSETIGGSHTQRITGSATETISGSLAETVTGGITTTTPAAINVTATAGMTVTAAGGIKITAPAGLHIISPAGVTQIDEFYKWIGVQQISIGVLTHAITGLQIEGTLTQFSLFGVQYEDVDMQLVLDGVDMWTVGAKVKQRTMSLSSGVIKFVAKTVGIKS